MNASQAPAAPQLTIRDKLTAFYEKRDFEPVWSGDDDAAARAALVRGVLEHAEEQGLRSADYVSGLARWTSPPSPGEDAATYDVALTAAVLRYASDVRTGRTRPRDAYKDAALPLQTFDVVKALDRAISRDSLDKFLADLPPTGDAYRGLVAALARYRAIADHGGWPTVRSGDTKRLAARLAKEDPTLAAIPAPTDDDISQAIARFEIRNGMKVDGKAGPAVIDALNVPASWRVKQIIANLERWRWLPQERESRYIEVNVPDQSLDYYRDGESVLHSRVIVGTKAMPTPVLRTMVKAVIANPPWDIPDSIAAKWLPLLRHSPNYLAKRNFVLANGPAGDPHGKSVDWRRVKTNNMPYQIQQPPGPDNVLGSLMLDMPNEFDAYLHDTSNKTKFSADMREISHGCVRVEEIFPLASLALTGNADDGLEKLTDAVATGETQHLALDDPLPVYLLYWTAIGQPDGTVGFRNDLYGRDKRLAELLSKGSGAPARLTAPGGPLASSAPRPSIERMAAKRD